MLRYPVHVPVFSCRNEDHPPDLVGALARQGIQAAFISDPASCSDDTIMRSLLDHRLVLLDQHCCRQAAISAVGLESVIGAADPQTAVGLLAGRLDQIHDQTPVNGAVLIGGKSSRMGRPKHLFSDESGQSWLERLLHRFEPFVSGLFVSGAGSLPASISARGDIERIDDLRAIQGPLAGVGALLAHAPYHSWLVCACDMPDISADAIRWLLDQRRPGCAALIPENPDTGRIEPLFAWYDYRSRPLVADMIAGGNAKIGDLCRHRSICRPQIPASLVSGWRNINYADELEGGPGRP